MRKQLLIGAIALVTITIIIFLVFFSLPASYKNSVKVNTHTINSFDSDKEQARIIVFSDIHLFYDYQVEDLERLINTINDNNPDIVIFNGDFFDNNSYESNTETTNKIIEILKEIQPIYGKFAILGDQDLKNDDIKKILLNSDFEILTNTTRNIRINDINFNLIGLYNNGKQSKALNNISDKSYNFALSHTPEIIDSIMDYKIDILVTGHTLGGQYNLPLYGSVFSSISNIPYYKGYTNVNGIAVYNSNGIGIYQSSMRFMSPSSIELFILK